MVVLLIIATLSSAGWQSQRVANRTSVAAARHRSVYLISYAVVVMVIPPSVGFQDVNE